MGLGFEKCGMVLDEMESSAAKAAKADAKAARKAAKAASKAGRGGTWWDTW